MKAAEYLAMSGESCTFMVWENREACLVDLAIKPIEHVCGKPGDRGVRHGGPSAGGPVRLRRSREGGGTRGWAGVSGGLTAEPEPV